MPTAGRELPKKIIYLELLDSLLDADGGEGRVNYRLGRDFPWLYEEGWHMERWGLRRSKRIPYTGEPRSLRGPTFPLLAFPRVLLPAVVWATHFVQSMRRPRAGILVAYSPVTATGAAAALLPRRRSSALVVRIISDFSARSGALYGKRWESRILERLERFVLRRSDLVLPMSPSTHQIATRAGVGEERIIDLPHPAPGFSPDVPAGAEESQAPRITAAGRLVPDKGFDLLIEAFATVSGAFPDATLEVAGDGPQRINLEALARSLGVGDRVRFPGWLNRHEMPRFFGGALVAVLPSRINEGLGMVLVEAGAAGCALIGTDVAGIRDIVHPDRTGFLVPPNDPRALAEALRALLSDRALAKRLGEEARAEARAYTDRSIEAVSRVHERIIALRIAGGLAR